MPGSGVERHVVVVAHLVALAASFVFLVGPRHRRRFGHGAFRFSDAVLRHLVVSMEGAVTEPSPMSRTDEENEARRERDEMGDDDDMSLNA